jgi:hypothetical protein
VLLLVAGTAKTTNTASSVTRDWRMQGVPHGAVQMTRHDRTEANIFAWVMSAVFVLAFNISGCRAPWEPSVESELARRIEENISGGFARDPGNRRQINIWVRDKWFEIRLLDERAERAYDLKRSHHERRASFEDIIQIALADEVAIKGIVVTALYPRHFEVQGVSYRPSGTVPIGTATFSPPEWSFFRTPEPRRLIDFEWEDLRLKQEIEWLDARVHEYLRR